MAQRFGEILDQYDVTVTARDIRVGHVAAGFSMPDEGVSFLSEADIFGETSVAEPVEVKRRKSRLGAFISDFRDLKPGDFVVHVDHGIGRFAGLETITTQGSEREFMLLVYADEAKLFVPVERADLISRYSSGEATAPSLDRLGGIGWQKAKAKAKRTMRDMADELLKLYAERKLVTGHAFPPDMPWQHEFEEAFPYDLTADQAASIERQRRYGNGFSDGSADHRRCRIRQDGGCYACGFQGSNGRQADGRSYADDRACLPAFRDLQEAFRRLSGQGRTALAISQRERAETSCRGRIEGRGRCPYRHPSDTLNGR